MDGLTNLDLIGFDPGNFYMAAPAALYEEVVKKRTAVAGAAPRADGTDPSSGVCALLATRHGRRQ